MTNNPVDAYIAAAPPRFQDALHTMRGAIRAELDRMGVTYFEVISYAMPGYRIAPSGKVIAGFAAHTHRCGFYPHSGNILAQVTDQIGERTHTKSALHFGPDDPIPHRLLARILDLRLREAQGLS